MTDISPSDLFRAHGTLSSVVARELKINKSTVSPWKRVPAERVLEIESTTGIPREEIRPDIYPPVSPTKEPA